MLHLKVYWTDATYKENRAEYSFQSGGHPVTQLDVKIKTKMTSFF